MNQIQKIQNKLDKLQQKNHLSGFMHAVIWKYGDDKAGYLAALLTYYGFLSLFPLLLVVTTVTNLLSSAYPHFQETVINSINSYFPVIGEQLAGHIHSIHQSGFLLLAAVLFTLYGARGVASVFRYGVNTVWHIPKSEQLTFPRSTANNFVVILLAGSGLILAAAVAAAIVSFDASPLFRIVSIGVNAIILFWLFILLLKLSLPKRVSLKNTWTGAVVAAVGLVVLQTLGGIVLARQLKHLDALYSYFAVSLGLLFWIYLQAQLMYWAIEISVVSSKRLWPRTFDGKLIKND